MRPTARLDYTEWEKEKEELFHELASLYLDVKVRNGEDVSFLIVRNELRNLIEKK